MSLLLTPTRLDLLTACQEQRVVVGFENDHIWLIEAGHQPRKVCSRIREAERAGWVELDEAGVFWTVTAAGREAAGWQP